MSFKKLEIYPPNPSTTRGTPTKLSSSKDKVIYASGRTVIVRSFRSPAWSRELMHCCAFHSYAILRSRLLHVSTHTNSRLIWIFLRLEPCAQRCVLGPHTECDSRANLAVWVLLRVCGCDWERYTLGLFRAYFLILSFVCFFLSQCLGCCWRGSDAERRV